MQHVCNFASQLWQGSIRGYTLLFVETRHPGPSWVKGGLLAAPVPRLYFSFRAYTSSVR
ncbi:hypothetical protein M3J09_006957 [Ascochyta lentis]